MENNLGLHCKQLVELLRYLKIVFSGMKKHVVVKQITRPLRSKHKKLLFLRSNFPVTEAHNKLCYDANLRFFQRSKFPTSSILQVTKGPGSMDIGVEKYRSQQKCVERWEGNLFHNVF